MSPTGPYPRLRLFPVSCLFLFMLNCCALVLRLQKTSSDCCSSSLYLPDISSVTTVLSHLSQQHLLLVLPLNKKPPSSDFSFAEGDVWVSSAALQDFRTHGVQIPPRAAALTAACPLWSVLMASNSGANEINKEKRWQQSSKDTPREESQLVRCKSAQIKTANICCSLQLSLITVFEDTLWLVNCFLCVKNVSFGKH